MPVRRRRPARAAARDLARAHRSGLALLPARGAPGPALRLPRARPVPSRGGPSLQPAQAAARPVREEHHRAPALERRALRLHRGPPPRRPLARPPRQRARHAEVQGDRPGVQLGRGPAPGRPVERDGDLRDARSRIHHAPSRRAGAAPRHLRRARLRRRRRPPAPARRDDGGADAGARVRRRPPPRRARPRQLLGLQHDRLLRAGHALRRLAQGVGVQDDGEDAALGRHRGDPRRRLQPHRGRQRARTDALVPRHRQRVLLPASGRRTAATTSTSPAAATPSTWSTRACCSC